MRDQLLVRMRRASIQQLIFLVSIGIVFVIPLNAAAQVKGSVPPPHPPDISAEKSSSDSDKAPLTTFEEEMRAKRMIKIAEKEHEENLKRAREISQISEDLKAGVTSPRSAFGAEDIKKVDRLEKLTKKIRGEAGGEADEVQIINAPADIPAALSQIADNADQLSKDVQKTPRQVVSAAVIDRANVLLQLVKILR